MEIIFSIIGIILLITLLIGCLVFILFMAKKMGFIKSIDQLSTPHYKSLIANGRDKVNTRNGSLIIRFIVIVILVGLMNIPLNMVDDVVKERSGLYQDVLYDIAKTWGGYQVLQGPILLVPYTEKINSVKTLTDKDGYERKVNQTKVYERVAIVLPDELKINGKLNSETRQRSLYEAQVYSGDMSISGTFSRPDMSKLSNNITEIHWDKAWLTLGLSDTQAINQVSRLNWYGSDVEGPQNIDFSPSTKIVKTIANGFHAPLDLSINEAKYTFSLAMNINGSKGIYFSPVGKTTQIGLQSDWPHPSFQGDALPAERTIDENGFTASWSIPNLARSYPQLWTLNVDEFALDNFIAGVDIFESISLYSKITRAIKYGSLFFILTYITFLIFELGINRRLHIVQYGMIGLALSMFYLTLLSLAEHIGFFSAYLSAASIIITMVSLYAYSAIRNLARTSLITLLLAALYSMLYSMLKLEESALISGTALLLLILGVMMYMTRNIGRTNPTYSKT